MGLVHQNQLVRCSQRSPYILIPLERKRTDHSTIFLTE